MFGFSGIFGLFFIIMVVSILTGLTRGSSSSLGYRDNYPPQLDPRRYPQIGMGPNQQFYGPPQIGYGPQGYGYGQRYPQGFDPASQQPVTQAALDAVNRDITTFGEQLRDLDLEVVGRELTPEANADYGKALDAYDGAKHRAEHARTNADIKRVAQILEEGRYNIATVQARVNGQPLPEHRPPCFFDPAHGTSVENVQWAPPGGAMREVPACAADAQRVRTGHDPSIRMVQNRQMMPVPYWEDPRQAAWAQGYYGRYYGDPVIRQITSGAMMIGGFSLLMGLLDD